jgi:signal transduction histidine kinase
MPPLEHGSMAVAFLFVLFVSLFIGTALTTIGGKYFLRPLRRLTDATKEIAAQNFNVSVDAKGPRELKALAENFNEMAKELAKVEILREDFISNISHELTTPLASIQGFAKRLIKSNLTDAQRFEYLSIIISESERLSKLSSNVLLLSNLESTENNTEQAEYALDEQLRRAVLLLEPQFQRKRLETTIDLEPVRIIANEEMLNHLWINLLGNAIKFSHEGGAVEVTLKKNAGNAIVSVSDQGVGMETLVKRRIFEKFYQGDRSRKTEGNGLGLSLVKKILELENGEITVDSEPGKGTCFTVRLPIHLHQEKVM